MVVVVLLAEQRVDQGVKACQSIETEICGRVAAAPKVLDNL